MFFLFDVIFWAFILPVLCVRVADIGFYFVPTRKVKLSMKVHLGLFYFFSFRSFRLFLFDVMCWAFISLVWCVRVAEVGLYFVFL